MNFLFVFIGGGLGSLVRFGISEYFRRSGEIIFPVATLCSNALSCAVLAIMVGVFREKIVANPSLQFLIITGFCGGFSTFSTFSFETVNMMREGHTLMAFANIFISIVVCFSIVYFLVKNS